MSDQLIDKKYWKSLEEREHLEQGAPLPEAMPEGGRFEEAEGAGGLGAGVLNLLKGAADVEMDRMAFLKLMGFSVAGATLAGCANNAEKALPYLVQPEEVIPGNSVFYNTVCGGCSAGCGAMAKTRSGRPLKMEGNPEYPLNQGGLCAMGQASILGVYDSKRLKAPKMDGKDVAWADFDSALKAELKKAKGKIRVVSRTIISPSLRSEITAFVAGLAGAKWVEYDPLSASAILDAHLATHGRRVLPHYRFDQAQVIASFGADFLGTWISPVEFARAYRNARNADDAKASYARHYQVESGMSITGGKADLRLTVKPSQITAALAQLARALGISVGGSNEAPLDSAKASAMAADLKKAGSAALVVCGSNDLQAQLLTNEINNRLGAYGKTVDLKRPSYQRRGDDKAAQALADEIVAGQVGALIVVDANPAYELPGGAKLAEAIAKIGVSVSLAGGDDETSLLCKFRAPESHWLESFGDAEPIAGLVGVVQPVLNPMANTRPAIESFAAWRGKARSAQDIVRDHVRSLGGNWDQALLKGYVESSASQGAPGFRGAAVKVPASAQGLEVELIARVGIQDGRHAVNPWLQELPDPVTKLAWDQAINIAPETAKKLGLKEGDHVKLSAPGVDGALELPLHLQAGQNAETLSVPLGYGREGTQRFHGVGPNWLLKKDTVAEGQKLGLSVNAWLAFAAGEVAFSRSGAELKPTGEWREAALTQMHQSLRVPENLASEWGSKVPVVQEMTLEEARGGKEAKRAEAHEGAAAKVAEHEPSLYSDYDYKGHRWAMVIDMNACNGCSACVLACNVENNVPVVGRDEVRRGHEMHWLRIDRYYTEGEDGLEVVSQPMLCQHCGHAPCEPVCPANATNHSSEGLNAMVYNRCVGTRYCANNCPFKVRRFNWFFNEHEDETANLALNPDVTVRSRGVMEKCSFCSQRISEEKAISVREGRDLRDGDIKTACQQSCPAQAISFGDINDAESQVSKQSKGKRGYKVLEELGVQPMITYLANVRNKA